MSFTRPLAYRARIAGSRCIDEHQIALVEQAVFVCNHLERRTAGRIRTLRNHAHRPNRTHLQPKGCRPRTAVIKEGNWPRLCVGAIFRISHVEETVVWLFALVVVFFGDQQIAYRRRVVDRPAAYGLLMLRRHSRFLWNWNRFVRVILGVCGRLMFLAKGRADYGECGE